MNYTLYPIFTYLLLICLLPLFLKNKKIFFKKKFFFKSTKNFNINLFFTKLIFVLTFYMQIIGMFLILPSSFYINNIMILVFWLLGLQILFICYVSRFNLAWELTFIVAASLSLVPFFFYQYNFFNFFFLFELIANLYFFLIFLKSFLRTSSSYNLLLQFNYLYYQLLLNSLVSVFFVFLLIYINYIYIYECNYVYQALVYLIFILKIGLGPAFFFKWYIYKYVTILFSYLLSLTYYFIFFCLFLFLYKIFIITVSSYLLIFMLISQFYVLGTFFSKITTLTHFIQYSSFLTYSMFILLCL